MRAKLSLFFLAGVVFVLCSQLSSIGWLQSSLVNLGAALITISLANMLWAFWGPDPLHVRISELENKLIDGMSTIAARQQVLRDVVDQNLGIERLWKNRRAWESDPSDGLSTWYDRVKTASQISMMGNILWANWFENPRFIECLCLAVGRGANARVIIYAPEASAIEMRAAAIGDIAGATLRRMKAEGYQVLAELANLSHVGEKPVSITLSKRTGIPALLIHVDDHILVSPYLVGVGQGRTENFTLQVHGSSTELFRKYHRVFDDVWALEAPACDPSDYVRTLQDRKVE
jgi:hypothetical protein